MINLFFMDLNLIYQLPPLLPELDLPDDDLDPDDLLLEEDPLLTEPELLEDPEDDLTDELLLLLDAGGEYDLDRVVLLDLLQFVFVLDLPELLKRLEELLEFELTDLELIELDPREVSELYLLLRDLFKQSAC